MSKRAGLGGGPGALIAGAAAAAAVLVAALYLAGVFRPDAPDTPVPQPATHDTGDAVPAASGTATPGDVPAEAASPEIAAPDTVTPPTVTPDSPTDTAAAPGTTPATEAPRKPALAGVPAISTFRLDPDGRMLVAGRAEPGWDVSVLVDEEALATLRPDDRGEFVAFLDLPPSAEPRILSLRMRDPASGAEVVSDDEIIIAPTPPRAVAALDEPAGAGGGPERAAPMAPSAGEGAGDEPRADTAAPPEMRDRTTGETSAESADSGQAAEPRTPETADVAAETGAPAPDHAEPGVSGSESVAAAEPVAGLATEPAGSQAVLLSDRSGVRVIQPPVAAGTPPEVMSVVALDAISYDAQGDVALSGRAPGDGFVRVYIDNTPVVTAPVAPDGSWDAELPPVDAGVYTLRVDQVDEGGTVVSRVETPFKREDRSLLAADRIGRRIEAITVQPGNTLWAISRDRYGEGILYVRIFEANRDRIRDPDLIYPGQVFTVPQ